MKSNLQAMGLAAIALMSVVIGSAGTASAQFRDIRVNPDVLKNPHIPQINLVPTIYGSVSVNYGQYSRRGDCDSITAKLMSPSQANGGTPTWVAKEAKLTGGKYAGQPLKCKYSIDVSDLSKTHAGQKAFLVIENGDLRDGGLVEVTIPSKPTKIDTSVSFYNIG